ncbi:MAG: acetyl-CoA carboxylase carboxyl transferase subunit alpha, partial [Myxococcota bacterium]
MASIVLPFEKPIVELLARVREVRELASDDASYAEELSRLEQQAQSLANNLLSKLSPIQKVQLSRHASRPYTLDYVARLFDDFVELKGDRRFA